MKKRNLLLAVMAALTLSGCMLNQTEEKVYKTAEELPDDPVERYKAVASLCKFNGVESDVCKDNQIYIKDEMYRPADYRIICFNSRENGIGKFNYSKKYRYDITLRNELLKISKEECDLSNIESYCRNFAELHPVNDDHYLIAYYKLFEHDFNKEFEKISYLNKSCNLGNIKSCCETMFSVTPFTNDWRTDNEKNIFINLFVPLFKKKKKSNYIKLYRNDIRALRYQKFEKEVLSSNFKEAARLAYNYCINEHDEGYCSLNYGVLGGRGYVADSGPLTVSIDLRKSGYGFTSSLASLRSDDKALKRVTQEFNNREKEQMEIQGELLMDYQRISPIVIRKLYKDTFRK